VPEQAQATGSGVEAAGDRLPVDTDLGSGCHILHVDMDSFFASVEVLDDPSLVGKPVVVGGTGKRGVVASCTYEARAYGIRSAMPSVEARRRCPRAIFLTGRYDRYAATSERLHEVLARFTPVVEPIALDEAFLDIAGGRRALGGPTSVAERVRAAVRAELSLECSVGVARTKLIAKLASRAAKPRATPQGVQAGTGVVVVVPGEEIAFLRPLPASDLWGVGPATARRLAELGVMTVGDLAAVSEQTLCRRLGTSNGRHLARLARGEDARPVEAMRHAKSVGHEETFANDLRDGRDLRFHLVRMAEGVGSRLREGELQGRTITVKVRYGDFTTITRSHTLARPTDSPRIVREVAGALLDTVEVSAGVRLLGVSVSSIARDPEDARQLSFDEEADSHKAAGDRGGGFSGPTMWQVPGDHSGADRAAWEDVEEVVANIRARYGDLAIGPTSLVRTEGLTMKRRGDTQWGPSEDQDGDERRTV
jgi:DNA polymerase IV